jgi:hypothetical protein
MSLLKVALVVPALMSGLFWVKIDPGVPGEFPPPAVEEKSEGSELEREVISRRIRIEKILMTLEYVAEVTMEMHPDQLDAVEPVIADIADQTLELTSIEAVLDEATDKDLQEIEATVDDLVYAIERYVEPQINL